MENDLLLWCFFHFPPPTPPTQPRLQLELNRFFLLLIGCSFNDDFGMKQLQLQPFRVAREEKVGGIVFAHFRYALGGFYLRARSPLGIRKGCLGAAIRRGCRCVRSTLG